MRRFAIAFTAALLSAIASGALPAASAPQRPQQEARALKDPPELKPLKYRSIGPAWGGRVTRVAGVAGDPNICYAAAASGGVWKSTDGGFGWTPIFDGQPISSIGSIAVAPSDPNVVYVGTGEANIRGNVAAGNGIYRSIDAGKTWTHVWNQEGQIGAIVVHPRRAEVAYAAVLGKAFGPNPDRGVYRTTDGGETWAQVLKKDADTGASDVALDPSNPNIVFAGLWQARRSPWSLVSGGPGSGLYLSRDAGDTWTRLDGKEKSNGLPDGPWGKVGVAVAPSDGRRVYAIIEADQGGLFRSDDGADSWERVSANRLVRQRPWYYSTMTVHPSNPNEIWFPQVEFVRSIDGGKSLTIVKIKGWDSHDIWIDPKNGRRLIIGSDAGVDLSTDGGETWRRAALPIGQFYHVSADTRVPFHVAGSLQDIGTVQGPSRSLSSEGIRNVDWHGVGGGEAGHVVSDPTDPDIVYAGEYGGYISRYDHRAGQARNVAVFPENPSGHGAADFKYRFQWTAPIAISPHDSKVIYHAGNMLFRTDDGGQSWTAISGDLTRNDKTKQQWSGGPITGDNTGVETYGTIFALAESPRQRDLIWAGSDDGLVHLTRDGGKTWTNVTKALPGLPEWGTVTSIEASRHDAGTAYVVVDNHRLDDNRPYLYKTGDFGETWQRLDGALPEDVYLHVVREDPVEPDMLYLGTERGVAFSRDGGRSWSALKLNLPTVAVHDLVVKDGSLVVGTHGRSMWIFDLLQVLRELSPKITGQPAHLFAPPPAVRWRFHDAVADVWAGDNPRGRVTLAYWLKEAPKGEVTIEVLDGRDEVVATLSSTPRPWPGHADNQPKFEEAAKKAALTREAGVNVAAWDLAHRGAELLQDAKLDGGDPTSGPLVVPGTYTLRLTVEGRPVATTTLTVQPDPRVKVPQGDLEAQVAFALSIRNEVTRLTRLGVQIRSVREQLVRVGQVWKDDERAAGLVKQSAVLVARLDDLEARIHNPKAEVVYDILAFKGGAQLYSRLAPLFDAAKEPDGVPTQGMKDVYAAQKLELDGYEKELARLFETELAPINEAAKGLGLPHIVSAPKRD